MANLPAVARVVIPARTLVEMVLTISPVNTAAVPVNGPSVGSLVSMVVPIVVAPMVAVAVLLLGVAAMTTVVVSVALVIVVAA